MLHLKSTLPTAHVGSLEAFEIQALRAENLEHEISGVVTSIESAFHKVEAMTITGNLLNNIPVLSMESAALVEVVSRIISQGTDLSGVSDFVPSIEAHVIEAVPTNGKGNGFTRMAGKVKDGIAAMINKLVGLLKRGFSYITGGTEKATKRLTDLGTLLTDQREANKGDRVTIAAPQYRIDAIVNKNRDAITKFIHDYSAPELGTSETLDASAVAKVKGFFKNTSDILSKLTVNSKDSDFENMLDIPTKAIYHYALPQMAQDGIISFRSKNEARGDANEITSISSISTLESDFLKPTKAWLADIQSKTTTHEKTSSNLEKAALSLVDQKEASVIFEMLKVHRFAGVTVPMAILTMVNGAISDIEASIKATA